MEDLSLSNSILKPKEYFDQLIQEFPDLLIEDNMGVYFSMEDFADYTIKQVKTSDWNKLKNCFDFQEQRIKFLSPDLENALNVSYCESLLLGGQVQGKLLKKTIEYMGPLLRKVYNEYEEYYNNLVKASNEKKA